VKNRLKVLRAERDWSQSDLADQLGVSRQTINAIETEKYDPSLPLALKIGRLFDQCVEKIFLDEPAAGSEDPALLRRNRSDRVG
jgi:putative transcriptional regulator